MFALIVPVTCLLVFFIAHKLFGYFLDFANQRQILMDVPNQRSSHSRPTVRGAGIVFVSLAIVAWLFIQLKYDTNYLWGVIIGASLIATIGFIDDLRGLSIRLRLLVQVLAALVFLSFVPTPEFLRGLFGHAAVLIWIPAATLFLVTLINLYNFIDGIDGLLASHTVCIISYWMIFHLVFGVRIVEVYFCLAVVVPVAAFLIRNWSPAEVFMGDVGSTFIGFTIGALAVTQAPGIMRSTNFLVLVMMMLPVLFDATFTIAVRFLKGEQWYLAHNYHIFQRLLKQGYTHANISLAYCCMTLYMGTLVFLTRSGDLDVLFPGILLFLVPFVGIYSWVRILELEIPDRLMRSTKSEVRKVRRPATNLSPLERQLELFVYPGSDFSGSARKLLEKSHSSGNTDTTSKPMLH